MLSLELLVPRVLDVDARLLTRLWDLLFGLANP